MDTKQKIELIKRNTVEIVTEEELKKMLKSKTKPTVYCGYEPSGPLHLGHFVTITKLMDFQKAGFNVIILLADVHAKLNRKGEGKFIDQQVKAWEKTIKAIGLKAKIVLGSSFQFNKEYITDVMSLAQSTTIQRGLRSMQEVGRDIDHATISQAWYPLMQIVDMKHLKVNIGYGGLEQRKIHMLARESEEILKYKPTIVHTPLITSLKGPGSKMSSSVEGSNISVTDSDENIKKLVAKAHCPAAGIEDNPILQIAKLIVFPKIDKLEIKRPDKFGGNISFSTYEELEQIYSSGNLHPMDLKNAVAEELIKIITPIRKNFKK